MTNSGITDLISRAAALEVIEAVKNVSWSQSGKVLCSKMYSQIKDIPAVDEEQEPRVMTLEEVVGSIVLGRDVTLWFEFKDSIKELNAKDIGYSDYLYDDDMPTLYEPNLKWRDNGYRDGVIVAEYNDIFRCWTSNPTEEQMKAVKWE